MEFLHTHIGCPSTWRLELAPGPQTYAALALIATGGLFVACRVFTFVRVLLSLFVLPGKSVCDPMPAKTLPDFSC